MSDPAERLALRGLLDRAMAEHIGGSHQCTAHAEITEMLESGQISVHTLNQLRNGATAMEITLINGLLAP